MLINDLPQAVKFPCLICADGLKFWRVIREPDDRKQLQENLDALDRWLEKWHLPVDYEKCAHMQAGPQRTRNTYSYYFRDSLLQKTDGERYLEVMEGPYSHR